MSFVGLRKTWYRTFLLFCLSPMFIAPLLCSCATNPASNSNHDNGVVFSPVQSSATNPVSNSKPDEQVIFFPVQKSVPVVHFMDVFEGKLVINDGYIRAVNLHTGESVLVIWPHGYSLDISHHPVRIMDEKSQVVAQVGDNVKMGSGGSDIDVTNIVTGQTLTAESIKDKKPFWQAYSVEFYPFLPVYSVDRLEANQFNSTTRGLSYWTVDSCD